MKKGFNLWMILCAVAFILSCSNSKSYTDRLNDEQDAIDEFLDENGFEVIKNYPSDSIFGEKQFIKLSSGLYLNIIDSGNGNRAVYNTPVLMRASGTVLLMDTFTFNGFDPLDGPSAYYGIYWPLSFRYGTLSSKEDSYSTIFSAGLMSALEHVGDSSVVRLIVPFKLGSSYQQNNYIPIYYDRVRYIFEK